MPASVNSTRPSGTTSTLPRNNADSVSAWLVSTQAAAARLAESKQREIDTEQARIASARRDGTPYSTEMLLSLRRDLSAARDILRRASVASPLSIDPPGDRAKSLEVLGVGIHDLNGVYVSVGGLLPGTAQPPSPAAFDPPVVDLSTVFIQETTARTPTAMTGWIPGAFLEVISFTAFWRGGRRVPLADRVRDWWRRIDDVWAAARRQDRPVSIPVMIRPMNLVGPVYLNMWPDFSLADCLPHLREMLRRHPEVGDRHAIASITALGGRTLAEHAPLIPQLGDGRLVITMEAA